MLDEIRRLTSLPGQQVEGRARDPYGNRGRSLWELVNEYDSLQDGLTNGLGITQVYTACRVFGNAMGSLEFSIYERQGDSNIERPNHSISRLFTERINTYMTPFDWFLLQEYHVGVTGNSFSYIVRNTKGEPIELIPLDPHDLVEAKLVKGEKTFVWGKDKKIIKDKDMFHITGPGWDGILGKNPIQVHREIFGTADAMRTYLNKFFTQGAAPKYVLESDDIVDDQQYAKLMGSWNDVFAGPANAGKTVILEEGMRLKQVSLSPVDAAYLELHQNTTKAVANIYGLPLFLFNEYSEGAQYDNIEQQDLGVIKYAIRPKAIKYEQEIHRKLLPEKGTKFFPKFDLFSLARGDMGAISEWTTAFFQIGSLSPDEIRKKYLGLNPLPDGHGNRWYVQGNNMVPTDMINDLYESKLQQARIAGEGGRPPADQVDPDMEAVNED